MNLIVISALTVFLILSFFSIPTSTLFSPSLKNLKPIEIGVLYKSCTTDAQCDLNQKCFKDSCRNKICVDTDGGIVPEIFGTVSVSFEGNPPHPIYYSDVCANSLNIKEFFCTEYNNPSMQEILCPGVCQNGACVPAICGDGIISQNEQCDGTNLDGKTCADFGFDSGTLTCDSNCQFDTSQCVDEQDCTNNIPPTAILPDDISNFPIGKPLTIFSESTDSDGQIVLYSWNFGDPQFVGNRLYVKTPSGLTVLSMENLPNIEIVNSFPQLNFGGLDNKLDKTKNLLYSIYGYNVSIFNITNPDNPTLIWAVDDASYLPSSDPQWHSGPTEISISDDLLAIGECASGLGSGKFSFFNVSNPLIQSFFLEPAVTQQHIVSENSQGAIFLCLTSALLRNSTSSIPINRTQ